MATVATLNVLLKASTEMFRKDMTKAQAIITDFAKRSALGLIGAGGVVYAIRRTAEEMDSLSKMARRLGLSGEALGMLEVGAKRSGIAIEQASMAVQRMTRRLSEASIGTGEAVKAIAELGLDAEKLGALKADQQLMAIATAMQRVQSESDKVRLAFKLFDSEGVKMLTMLEGGAKGLKGFRDEALRLGIVMDDRTRRSVEMMNDQLSRLQDKLRGIQRGVVREITNTMTLFDQFRLIIERLTAAWTKNSDALGKNRVAEMNRRRAAIDRKFEENAGALRGIDEPFPRRDRIFGGVAWNQLPGMGFMHSMQGQAGMGLLRQISSDFKNGWDRIKEGYNRGPNPFTDALSAFLRENQARTAGALLRDIGGTFGGGASSLFRMIGAAFQRTIRPEMPILGAVERGSVEAAYAIAQAKRDSRNNKVFFDQLGEQRQIRSILGAINSGIKDALVRQAAL